MGKHNDTHLHPGTDKSAWIMRNVIEYLFDNAATGTSGSLATTLILTYGVYNLAPDSLVFGWAAAALLIALLRSLLLIYYRRASADTPLEKFLQPYRFLVLVSGVVVGLGCWLFVPIIPLEYQVMFIGAVLGINGGGIAVYAADHLTYKLFMFPSCLISIATLIHNGSDALTLMAVLFVFFMLVMYKSSKRATMLFLENISLSFSLHYRATHDSLTGLLNRGEFEDCYELYAPKTRHGIALLFVDLDNFKTLNDTCGHKAGDDALVYLGELMKSAIRQDDRAARLGGDEFVAMLFLDDLSVAERAADKIRRGIQAFKPTTEVQPEVALSCSIGIAFSATSSVSYQTIMSRADKACYQSKARGKDQYTVDRIN